MTSDVGASGPSTVLSPQQIIEAALEASTSDGCIVVVEAGSEANVRWANNTVTTSGVSDGLSWFVVSVVGGAAGTVSASIAAASSAATVAEVVRQSESEAAASASAGRAEDFAELVEPAAAGGSEAGYELAGVQTSFDVYQELLTSLAAAFEDARSGEQILYGFARHEMSTVYLGTSTGVRRRWVQPTGTVELNAKSADLTRSAWSGASTADFVGVDLHSMAGSLTTRLDWARRSIDLPPGRYDTVLPPTAVADFMILMLWKAGARGAHQGRSAFSAPGGTRISEKLTDLPLSLYSDSHRAGLETAPWVVAGSSSEEVSVFDNGAAVGRADLVSEGSIANLLHTRASAAEYGEPFLPGADNLVLDGGDGSVGIDDLVAGVRRGLLVTSQWYLREVDPTTMLTTGLTRDGVFLIENGEIAGAVNNFRFNMSPLEVLRRASAVGRTEPCLSREWSDWFTRTAMPPMVVDGFNMSSVSKAQ